MTKNTKNLFFNQLFDIFVEKIVRFFHSLTLSASFSKQTLKNKMTNQFHGVSEINSKYRAYYCQIFELYEDFLFVEYYYPELHNLLKEDKISLMKFEGITSNYVSPFKKSLIYGVIDRTLKKKFNSIFI